MTTFEPDRARSYLRLTLGSHAAFTLHFHLVWSVRARRPLLIGAVADRLAALLPEAAERAGVTLMAVHIEPEHVHVLLSLSPNHAVAPVVHQLKGASSHALRAEFEHLRAAHNEALWNIGYFVRTLGMVHVAQAKAYLDRQRSHHHGMEQLQACEQGGTSPAVGEK